MHGLESTIINEQILLQNIFISNECEKTKIYGYLEALLGTSESDKQKIKEREREYYNALHWNLDAEYLSSLKEFLEKLIY